MSDVFYEDYEIHSGVGMPEVKSDTNSESEPDEAGSGQESEDEPEDFDLNDYVDFPNDRIETGMSRLLEVFPDIDPGFLQTKNLEFEYNLSKINDWIQDVWDKDLARDFPPKVSEEFSRMVNDLMEMFPNLPNDYIKEKLKDLMDKPNPIEVFVEDVLQTDFKKDFVNISEFLKSRQMDAEEGKEIVNGEKLLQIQKNCGIEGLEICPFCPYAYIPPQPMGSNRKFYCQNQPNCDRTSCRICKKEIYSWTDFCGCRLQVNPSTQSNTQWEWQQQLILEDSASQNVETPSQDGAASSNTFAPGINNWGNLNLSSLFEFSECGTRIICQKCKIDMNEIFKSSKKHACETETETVEGAVGGQGTLASNTNNREFELAAGNEDQDHFESLPPSPAASEKELAKNEEFERTLAPISPPVSVPLKENETKKEATGGQVTASAKAIGTGLNETKEGATGGQVIAPASEMDSKDEFDSLIDRFSESLGIDSSAEFFDEAKRQQFFAELSDEEEFFEAQTSPPSAIEPEGATGQNNAGASPNSQNPKTNIKFEFKIKFESTQAADNMKKEIKQALIEVKSNTDVVRPLAAQESPDNDPLEVSAASPPPAPTPAPVLLGATPKFQLATPQKGNNKENLDDSTPKKEM